MLPLFPEIKPYKTSRFAVTPPHELHVEECGNPDGVPVLFLHGGPGAGCGHNSRRFYDPKAYRIILFDQRGAGQSEPHACTDNNTLADLISDIEALLVSWRLSAAFCSVVPGARRWRWPLPRPNPSGCAA